MKLKKIRKEKNITQTEMANYLKISLGTYSNYENGLTQPPFKTLIQIADYFNVSTDYLLGRDFQGGLSTDEYELISMYRQLIQPEQKRVLGFLEFETSLKENLKENKG